MARYLLTCNHSRNIKFGCTSTPSALIAKGCLFLHLIQSACFSYRLPSINSIRNWHLIFRLSHCEKIYISVALVNMQKRFGVLVEIVQELIKLNTIAVPFTISCSAVEHALQDVTSSFNISVFSSYFRNGLV